MISPRLAMTNNHVLENAAHGANSMIEFDFVEGLVESVQRSRFFSLDPGTFFLTSPGLDYTIIAVGTDYDDGEAQRRGWLSLIEQSGKILVGERLNIIQHPGGGPQKVGLRRNELESVRDDYLIYGTDTEGGSSGSPVCNDQWLLAALHHASVPERDEAGRFLRWIANEGVRISRIVADARQRLRRSTESTNNLFDAAFINMPKWATDVPGMALRSDNSIEIPVRLTVQVSTGVPGAGARQNAVAPPTPYVEPAEDNEFLDPPGGMPVFSNPQLECIVVRLSEEVEVKCLDEVIGEKWESSAVDEDRSPFDFDLLPSWNITVTEAWNVVHKLRASKLVVLAEPSWEIDSIVEEERSPEGEAEFFGFKTRTDRAAEKMHWAPDLIHVERAWDLPLPAGGKAQGKGIRIAHPDSGFTEHKELMEGFGAIDIDSGFDFVDNDSSALDEDGFHGTGTASVMMSGAGGDILGAAPMVTLVPMRVAQKGLIRPAPVLLRSGMRRLRKAISRAIDKGCHVISISLGWFGHSALHDVIQRAWDQNIIIVAAAGNFTGPLIVWPARYRECICMAGCDALRGIWEGSARGSRVDFTGPAQDVWKAGFKRNRAISTQSSGTSFATAMTAGVAALWLAFHGRDKLIDQYKHDEVRLTEVFRAVIERSADPAPSSWFGGFGGIVNAERALRTPLPDPREVRRSFDLEAMMEGIDIPAGPQGPSLTTALEILGEDYQEGRRRLADGLGVPEAELEKIADGCGDELAFHMVLAMGRSGMAARESLLAPILESTQMSERLRGQLEAK
jgi:thermitase